MIISMIRSLTFGSLLILGMASVFLLDAQDFAQDLNGFRLGQTRAVTHRELGKPDKQGAMDENVVFEAFLLNEEPHVYILFQYHKSEPELIWSIQVTGDDVKHDPTFKDLRLGVAPTEVEKRLGKPSQKTNVGEYGTLWEFAGRNFSIEINPANKLSSIRIVDDRSKEPDLKNLPKFPEWAKQLQSATNVELGDLLAPDVEVYDGGKARSFGRAMKNEIALDSSGVFGSVRRLAKELSSVDTAKADQYEEKLRLHKAREPQHVIRLPKLTGVTEITFRWNGEKWQVWEFGARPVAPPPQDWKSIYKPGSLKDIVDVRIPALIKNPNVALNKDDGKPLASFSYNSYPTSTAVKFTGESRKTPESTLSLISIWLETLGKSKDLAKRFELEFKFVENGVEYWIPTQHPLPERFLKEIKKDDKITIYLSWIGIEFENNKPRVLAIVNEFTPADK
jgi:hypothetical protein